MPGKKGYGPGGKWIHDRAHHIMRKNPGMDKSKAYAIATLQAHRLGKSPKKFRTAEGMRKARRKYDKPPSEYVKEPDPKSEKKAAFAKVANSFRPLLESLALLSPTAKTALVGGLLGGGLGAMVDQHSALRGALVGGTLGAGVGSALPF